MKGITSGVILILLLTGCSQRKSERNKYFSAEKNDNNDSSKISVDTASITSSTQNPTPTDLTILDIRTEYQRINTLALAKRSQKFTCDVEVNTAHFFENGKLVKIDIDWGFLGDGSSTSQYYYKNGKLIFIYETYIGGPANAAATRTEFRSYIKNDTTIRYMENEKEMKCQTCTYTPQAKEYKVLDAKTAAEVRAALCD